MKKIVILILVAGFITSCYDPYRTDYEHSMVAFSTATGSANDAGTLGRTVVMGEGLQLDMGVFLGGVIENYEEQWAKFEIDPTLLNGTPYQMMPDDYYTLSNENRFIIPQGEHVGRVTVDLDSTNFLSDPKTTEMHYAIPFRLTGTSADTINAQQSTKILVVKYINQYEGFYNQTGTFTTYDSNDEQINSGRIENVISLTTVMLDSVRTTGLIDQRGEDYMMAIDASDPDNISLEYIPNPNPPTVQNIALNDATEVSTSHVSPWETLEGVRDGAACSTCGEPKYGNWPDGSSWQWIQYDLPNYFSIERSDIYWWTDRSGGPETVGGLNPATDSYIEYMPVDGDQFVEVPNSKFSETIETYNELTFDPPIITNQIRVNIIHDQQSVGISEFRVFGLPAPVSPEQAEISTLGTVSGSMNSYDAATGTMTLNYRVDFVNGGYSLVETELDWRNRIRDGVNEWR